MKDSVHTLKHGNPKSFLRDKNFRAQPGTTYCSGCGHGLISKKIGEVIDDFGIADRTMFIASVGCSVFDYEYYNFDTCQVPHGRAPAAATGYKRARPDNIVITKQGDGDLAAIGLAEIVHAANRCENISVFFVNNAIYGMTGGQMAPTTLIGQETTTSPDGKGLTDGAPIRVCELLDTLGIVDTEDDKDYVSGPTYLERVGLYDVFQVRRLEQAVRKAVRIQIKNQGFSLVEILSPCPTNWKMSVEEAMDFTKYEMAKIFPLGVFRDLEDKR
ncbi:MAG: 2-oxoglutarate oxidoreductase [Nanoarchaeota archaeon]|nr:2-oxoglutarate oxidoreductase [Nanoarchaeota archaeon]